jgi:DNA repair photolyase
MSAAPLVGIAKLAAASPLLEAKRLVHYFSLPTHRYIGRVSGRRMPFDWTVNPYRGCEFGCTYCYARYTHEFMELHDPRQVEQWIYAKDFRPEVFRAELRRIPKGESICVGTATDPYQPAERRFRITERMLEILAGERGRTLSLTTKSDLVARDAGLLARVSESNNLHVHVTVTTTDVRLARLLEPYAPRPDLRFTAMRTLADAGVRVVAMACPVMPLLNDSRASLEAVAAAAKGAGARCLYANVLFLKPCAQATFFPFLEEHFPELVTRYRERFGEDSSFLRGSYVEMIRRRVAGVREKHGLTERPAAYLPEDPEAGEQLLLWS